MSNKRKRPLNEKLSRSWHEHRHFILFIVLMALFRSACADWNTVPTGSMKPTIIEGDRILVNKMAYDIRVPFTHISLKHLADPKRGDIIVFDSKVSGKRLVKRVAGMPGDVVALRDNVLYINGSPLQYEDGPVGHSQVHYAPVTPEQQDKTERLKGVEHTIRIDANGSYLSNFTPVTVPQGHYLALGDNRDNSADSRVIGFVPRGEIVGRTQRVVLSFNYDNFYIPRKERFLHVL